MATEVNDVIKKAVGQAIMNSADELDRLQNLKLNSDAQEIIKDAKAIIQKINEFDVKDSINWEMDYYKLAKAANSYRAATNFTASMLQQQQNILIQNMIFQIQEKINHFLGQEVQMVYVMVKKVTDKKAGTVTYKPIPIKFGDSSAFFGNDGRFSDSSIKKGLLQTGKGAIEENILRIEAFEQTGAPLLNETFDEVTKRAKISADASRQYKLQLEKEWTSSAEYVMAQNADKKKAESIEKRWYNEKTTQANRVTASTLYILWKLNNVWEGAWVSSAGALNEAYIQFYVHQYMFGGGMEERVKTYMTHDEYGAVAGDNLSGFLAGDVSLVGPNGSIEYGVKSDGARPMAITDVASFIYKIAQLRDAEDLRQYLLGDGTEQNVGLKKALEQEATVKQGGIMDDVDGDKFTDQLIMQGIEELQKALDKTFK